MPKVKIKGTDKIAVFPDDMDLNDIRSVLQKRFAQQLMKGGIDLTPRGQTIEPYNPSLSEKIGHGIAGALKSSGLISDNYRAQQVGKNITSIGEFLPGVGDATAGDEFGRALAEGDNLGMGMAALGAIPLTGDISKKIIKVYHGGTFKGGDIDITKTQRANLGDFYLTTDRESADNFSKSGFFDDDTINSGINGNVFEVDVPEDILINLGSLQSSDVIKIVGRDKIRKVIRENSPDEYDDIVRYSEVNGFDNVDDFVSSGGADEILENYIENIDPESSFEGPSVANTKVGSFLAANEDLAKEILEYKDKIGFKYTDAVMGGTTVALSDKVNKTDILKKK